jgi:hypothetical protein
VDLSTAPFLLALLADGSLSLTEASLFVEGGYAVYVAEGIDQAAPALGQTSDAWVVWLRDRDTYIPLAEALSIGLPDSARAMDVGVRAVLEGGSFIEWVAERYGTDAVEEMRDGMPIDQILDMPVAAAEAEWLAEVTYRVTNARPCVEVVPEGGLLRSYCLSLDGAGH